MRTESSWPDAAAGALALRAPLLAEIARLVGLTEDGAPVLDAPRMSVEAEMVVVERMVWLVGNL